MTNKKQRSTRRNWAKFQIKGMKATCNSLISSDVICDGEKLELKVIISEVGFILRNWRNKPPTEKEVI